MVFGCSSSDPLAAALPVMAPACSSGHPTGRIQDKPRRLVYCIYLANLMNAKKYTKTIPKKYKNKYRKYTKIYPNTYPSIYHKNAQLYIQDICKINTKYQDRPSTSPAQARGRAVPGRPVRFYLFMCYMYV